MLEWFSDLTSFQKIYWIITGISTLLFSVVLIGTFMGADTDDLGDIDAEMDADTGVGFQFFTFKNTVAFFAIFGWSGISALDAGYSKPITIIISMICGLLMMTLMGVLFFYMRKLNDS